MVMANTSNWIVFWSQLRNHQYTIQDDGRVTSLHTGLEADAVETKAVLTEALFSGMRTLEEHRQVRADLDALQDRVTEATRADWRRRLRTNRL